MLNKKAKIREDYNSTARYYDKRYSEIQCRKFGVLDGFPLSGQILDLGGGTGLLGRYLDNNDVINLDLSFEMLKTSMEINICGDLDLLPFKSKSFDSILSFTAIQNLPDFSKVFEEIQRVLRPKGLVIISVLNKVNILDVENAAKAAKLRIKEKINNGEDVQIILTS